MAPKADSGESTPTVVAVSRSSTAAPAAWQQIPQFDAQHQLCHELNYEWDKSDKMRCLVSRGTEQTLPDAPRIALSATSELVPYCLEDLDTPSLNGMKSRLWNAGPRPIHSMTELLEIGMHIRVTEKPDLHLVWGDDITYLKPIPAYICSYAFWDFLLDPANQNIDPEGRKRVVETSLGYLKSWSKLIRKRSDFVLAKKHDLLHSLEGAKFESFMRFIIAFEHLPDSAVSMRWRFGELSLSALNLWSFFRRRKWLLNRFEGRYGSFFENHFAVVLFIFAMFSVVLSAMQVILAGEQFSGTDNSGLQTTVGLFNWFSEEAIYWTLGFGLCFLLWFFWIVCDDKVKGLRLKKAWKKRQKEEANTTP